MGVNHYDLPYGKAYQTLSVDSSIDCDLILPKSVKAAENPIEIIAAALDSPIGGDPDSLKSHMSVAIAVNDKTRPVPHDVILPPLMDWLRFHGIRESAIKFWIATGSHLPMTMEEFQRLLPQSILDRYAVASHDINFTENLITLGKTSRGTPVTVNREYYHADYKIVVGDIEPHHFAGFSGGYKSAAIGLAGRETINHNHAMLVDPNSWIGVYETNPLRQDINEIGRMIKVDLALNTILNTSKQVVAALAGEPDAVMQKGIPISRGVCGTPITRQYDIVIASAGGYPKDINFYQAQKALTHASLFCKSGGTIILVAECPEGSGSLAYEEFMLGVPSAQAVFNKFRQMDFRVGPHKAYQVARLLDQFRIILVSNIPEEKVVSLLMEPKRMVQYALNAVTPSQRCPWSMAVLPHATTTLPL